MKTAEPQWKLYGSNNPDNYDIMHYYLSLEQPKQRTRPNACTAVYLNVRRTEQPLPALKKFAYHYQIQVCLSGRQKSGIHESAGWFEISHNDTYEDVLPKIQALAEDAAKQCICDEIHRLREKLALLDTLHRKEK